MAAWWLSGGLAGGRRRPAVPKYSRAPATGRLIAISLRNVDAVRRSLSTDS